MPDFPSLPTPSPSPSRQSRRTIPPLVLLSFAVIHSQVYWLYSVIYHLYSNFTERPHDLSMDETVLNALTKRSGRARAFSEPQHTSSVYLQSQPVTRGTSSAVSSTKNRPRSTTITASTVQADTPLRRQQWVQQVNDYYIHEQQKQALNPNEHSIKTRLSRTTILDERLGRTQAPRWWQRTRRHLIGLDKDDQDDEAIFSNLTSTLSLPEHNSASMDSETRTNQNSAIHSPQSVSPRTSCDHHDITTTDTTTNLASLSEYASSTTTDAQNSLSQVTMQQRRPLAKIRSVFIKSQIEPEHSEEPKRKSILGIPSRWSAPPIESSDTAPRKRLFASLRKHK